MATPADALSTALTHTRRVLFEPFDGAAYVGLGFCVWLSQLGSVSANASGWSGRGRGGAAPFDPDTWSELVRVVQDWGPVLVASVGIGTLVAIAVWVLLLFVRCRGLLMTIDGIVRSRGAVAEPWREYAPEADSLFRLRLTVNLVVAGVAFVLLGGWSLLTWSTWAGEPSMLQLGVLGVAGSVVGLVGLLGAVVDGCATEFVAPMMYVRRYSARDGFADLRTYAGRDLGAFALYVVLRIAVGIGAAFLIAALVCSTCGLALVPFVGTLVLLPIFVFVRTFALHFVAQQADDLQATLGPAS